ncbi:hypothetical protein IFM61606_06748 [Aspergillus udagawae]|uniref:C2H2-type domain-containing protein n=1 Tax=Aspergillus udagawae TaxID=91492 RepID=A0ABQ1A426_9EURO|nr:hypothetical protein IFM51744_07516 [Aspergillus udagawae]GFF73061.1 hypothetical protein IFM53868_00973 [Aspergillus udagawae]GFG18368.1 hypothetical protein IFM5058_08988 [Aspergillus udagawae]GFG26751.1 hypothetical protein IFM61606_06748 [Aspergillus udagawae]
MSTLSPQLVRSESPTDMGFPNANFSDPYLSAPLDPEQAVFKSSGIRLTPEPGQQDLREVSTSPYNQNVNSDSAQGAETAGYSTSYSDFLSPVDDFSSDLSAHASPNSDHPPGSINMELQSYLDAWPHNMGSSHIAVPDESRSVDSGSAALSQQTMVTSQLLTPDRTNHPSPAAELTNHRNNESQSHSGQMLTIVTAPLDNNLNVHPSSDASRARSPIVTVESYSRGDSPVRETISARRQPSQSFTHLSPGGESEDGDHNTSWQTPRQAIARTHDGSWLPDGATGQAGVAPTSRDDTFILSPNEVESQRRLEERNADIRSWSATVSVAGSEGGDDSPQTRGRKVPAGTRRRARSAGDPALQQDYFNLQFETYGPAIPGPGALIHESSDEELSGNDSGVEASDSGSPAASVNEVRWAQEDLAGSPVQDQLNSVDGEPAPHQFLATRPWQDPDHDSTPRSVQMQPSTASAAMMEYQRRAREIDAVSRYATWGTRPMSEVEVNSIIGAGGSFANLSISQDSSKKHARRSSLMKLFPRKPSISVLKRPLSDLSLIENQSMNNEVKSPPSRKDSFPHRKLSLARGPKSPSLSTGGAVIAIAGQMAAIGGRDSLSAVSPHSTSNPWNKFGRTRSRSEISRSTAPGLLDLMTSHGGPPVPTIGHSRALTTDSHGLQHAASSQPGETGDDDEEDEDTTEKEQVMDFPVLARLPVPTTEGFKAQITQLNPRLEPALIDRLANEQVRRYKKLIELKMNHTRAVSKKTCSAGKFCFAQGGEAVILATRAGPQDSEAAHTQFQITGHSGLDDEPPALGENAVTAAQFPPGVPLPPVKRLPAEFECPICFRVKRFQKPSDWTKHVHEDVQPFTCTFPHCNEPKSFKRKADWVRHESERHRKLEWWTCTVHDCHHTCYRKDNFVQHLVREHKMPEPKIKKTKTKGVGASSRQDPVASEAQEESSREREVEQLWELVDQCHHDTSKGPREEPCRFCGNVCSSWKKLTVHLAKHMEQIAMPVLALVQERHLSSYVDAGVAPKAVSYPGSIAQEATSFSPDLNSIKVEPDAAINFEAGRSEPPAGFLNPTYPPTSTTLHQGFLSAEPEAYTAYGSQAGLAGQHFVPVHQNSVTYPPLLNAGPRPRIMTPELSVLQNPYQLCTSPTEMRATFDPQGTLQMSPPPVENNQAYHDQIMQATSYSYDGSAGYSHQF